MTRLWLLILILLTGYAFGTNETYYVDPNATGANNGSSWADAYTALQTGENNIPGTQDTTYFLCRSSAGGLDGACSWDKTGSGSYAGKVVIIIGQNQVADTIGVWDTSIYTISGTNQVVSAPGNGAVTIVYQDVQFTYGTSGGTEFIRNGGNDVKIRFERCIFKGKTTLPTNYYISNQFTVTGEETYFTNCIFYDWKASSGLCLGLRGHTGSVIVTNSLFYNTQYALNRSSTSCSFYSMNNIFVRTKNPQVGTWAQANINRHNMCDSVKLDVSVAVGNRQPFTPLFQDESKKFFAYDSSYTSPGIDWGINRATSTWIPAAGRHTVDFAKNPVNYLSISDLGPYESQALPAWNNPAWQKRYLITADGTKITANEDSSFWLYAFSNAPADFWTNVQADGGDIFVTPAADTTKLKTDLVVFSKSSQKGEMYVRVDVNNSNSLPLFIYYDNPTVPNKPNDEDTYNKIFKAVYTFTDNPAGGILTDRTANNNDLTVYRNSGITHVAGSGGNTGNSAWNFPGGTGGYAARPRFSTSLNNISPSAFIKGDDAPTADEIIWYNGNSGSRGWGVILDDSDSDQFSAIVGGVGYALSQHNISTSQYDLMTQYRSLANTWNPYKNGVYALEGGTPTPNAIAAGDSFYIGLPNNAFDGSIDLLIWEEKNPLFTSAQWVTWAVNFRNPETFWSEGVVQTSPLPRPPTSYPTTWQFDGRTFHSRIGNIDTTATTVRFWSDTLSTYPIE